MDPSESAETFVQDIFNELPKEKAWAVGDLYIWEGFWYLKQHLGAVLAARFHFQARDDDILLSSSMKTGSTWLKALIPCIINAEADHGSDPLIENHPNDFMPSLFQYFTENPKGDGPVSGIPSPRLFRTHLPYSMLPDSIKTSRCKIVYITRDPKDTFVSWWHFMNMNKCSSDDNTNEENNSMQTDLSEAFESYRKGLHPFGPFHDHVLESWKESLKRPDKVLFLRYEELKSNPKDQIKRLALFLGRNNVNEEQIDQILWRCNIERLKNLDVNRDGVDSKVGFLKRSYFRSGLVGDWKNHFSMEMKEQLDELTKRKYEGSGLDFYIS